jgi:hypothetical protein
MYLQFYIYNLKLIIITNFFIIILGREPIH